RMPYPLVCHDSVHTDIPGLTSKRFDSLAGVRQPDQQGTSTPTHGLEGESAVVEPLAHSQPVALTIEAHQWHEHHIQCSGADSPGSQPRLQDAPAIASQCVPLPITHEQ